MERDEQARILRDALVDRLATEPACGGAAWDPRVLAALRAVPRHAFVLELDLEAAYEDEPQPIGDGQTISQPTVVALMTNALGVSAEARVLELGTGCGYQAAVLAELAAEVDTIEVVAELWRDGSSRLAARPNVRTHLGDGSRGVPERAPLDRMLLTAAPPSLPSSLLDPLAGGGLLVAPVGGALEELVRVRRAGLRFHEERLGVVRFVPTVAADGGGRER
ncbi:MAG: protein-L-isoaspartate O-methyltransferase [Deltaproteobacteria bacterium]|nr:protein-L-isoaspartate O-methyltransferase [Deltaproteobacteria bacterium]